MMAKDQHSMDKGQKGEEKKAPSPHPENLVWIDLEMTGLDPQKDVILQAALIITNPALETLDSWMVDIWQPESALADMVPFVREMHENNGLLERVRKSGVDTGRAEQEMLRRITSWCSYRPLLCGNTIHSDRKFIDQYMPALAGFLHYRMIDVTSIKEIASRWYGDAVIYDKPRDKQHDALFDIQQSIAELAHYRKTVFQAQKE